MSLRVDSRFLACLAAATMTVAASAQTTQLRLDGLHRELAQAIEPQADNSHLERLAALRALHDPSLQPLYHALCLQDDPAILVHGILGLGELTPLGRPDPERLAALPKVIRAQALSVAMSNDLLAPEDIRLILDADDLDPFLHARLLTVLAESGEEFAPSDIPRTPVTVDAAAGAAEAVLAARAGDTTRLNELPAALSGLPEVTRHDALFTALETVHRAPTPGGLEFAASILTADMPDGIRRYGLMVLCSGGSPTAGDRFVEELRTATRQRVRVDLALLLLMTRTAVPEGARETFAQDDLLDAMGRAADGLADDAPDTATRIIALADTGHRRSIAWMLDSAPTWPREIAVAVTEHLLEIALANPANQRTDLATAAASVLRSVDTDAFAARLKAADDDGLEQTALLVALLQEPAPDVLDQISSIRRIGLGTADMLTLLIMARDGESLAPEDQERLGLIATGGSASNAIRTQAAWLALRHGTDTQQAISRLIGTTPSTP